MKPINVDLPAPGTPAWEKELLAAIKLGKTKFRVPVKPHIPEIGSGRIKYSSGYRDKGLTQAQQTKIIKAQVFLSSLDLETIPPEPTEAEKEAIETEYKNFRDKLNEYIDQCLEYAEMHNDAGSNYRDILCESGITAQDVNLWSKDYRYPEKYKLTEDDLRSIIQNVDFEMVAGHTHTPSWGENKYCIESFSVNEIEEQLSAESLDLPLADFERLMRRYTNDRRHHVKKSHGTWNAYVSSNAVWYAVHTRNV